MSKVKVLWPYMEAWIGILTTLSGCEAYYLEASTSGIQKATSTRGNHPNILESPLPRSSAVMTSHEVRSNTPNMSPTLHKTQTLTAQKTDSNPHSVPSAAIQWTTMTTTATVTAATR